MTVGGTARNNQILIVVQSVRLVANITSSEYWSEGTTSGCLGLAPRHRLRAAVTDASMLREGDLLIPLQRHRIALGALLFLWSASAISANTLVAPFPNAPGPADAILS